MLFRQFILISLLVLISGCISMPDIKVEGISNLKVTEYIHTSDEVTEICRERMNINRFTAFFINIYACATIVLETWTCEIHYSLENTNLFPELLAHERLHCQGYWHDNGLQEYYDAWKAEQ